LEKESPIFFKAKEKMNSQKSRKKHKREQSHELNVKIQKK
jgi:hypothetical protein